MTQIKVLSKFALFILVLFSSSITPIFAHSITPSIIELTLKPGETVKSHIEFTNTADKAISLSLSAAAFTTTDHIYSHTEIFLTPLDNTAIIEAKSTKDIPFSITVPMQTNAASYLNVLILKDTNLPTSPTNTVNINTALGSLIRIDVIDSNAEVKGTLDSIFTSNTDTTIELIHKGIPLIKPTRLKFTYQNNSEYIFTPTGEIRFINDIPKALPVTKVINIKEKKAYPSENIIEYYDVNLWTLENLWSSFTIISRTSDLNSNTYIESKLDFDLHKEISIVVGTLVLIGATTLLLRRFHQAKSQLQDHP